MLIENSSTFKIMALGRQFHLGMLYNLRTDKLILDTSLRSSDLMPNCINYRSSLSSIFELHTEDTFTKKVDLLRMNANLEMSVLNGLVDVFSNDMSS